MLVTTFANRRRGSRRARAVIAGISALLVTATSARAADGGSSDRRFSLSGSNRSRYERLDPQFRAGYGDSDTQLAFQTSIVVKAGRGRFDFVAEIMDARAELTDEQSFVRGAVNALEPIQTYFSWSFDDLLKSGSQSTLRVGRMTLDIGKRRLLARSGFRHALATFAGADWAWQGKSGNAGRVFYFVPMNILPENTADLLQNEQELDRGERNTTIAGGYYLFAPWRDRSQADLSFMRYEANRPNGFDIDTLAVRVFRPNARGAMNYEFDGGLQRGHSAESGASTWSKHRAYFAHADVGFTFDMPRALNLTLQYDRASGDATPGDGTNERFNTLFGERSFEFGPTGIYGPFVRSNIDSLGVRATLTPAPHWRIAFAYRNFDLAERRDAWVGSGFRDATGQSGDSLGQQLEAAFNWTVIPDRLSLDTGFTHVRSGEFAKNSAGSAFRGDPRYFYAAVTTRF